MIPLVYDTAQTKRRFDKLSKLFSTQRSSITASSYSLELEVTTNFDSLRIFVYDHLVAKGLPPNLDEIAKHFGTTPADARQELATLKIGKTILVHPESGEIWMAGPFSAVKTDYQAVAGDRSWWANCAWDVLGIPMVLNAPVQVHTKCTDCGSLMSIDCSPSHPPTVGAVVHFLVPARRWYEDIAFT